MKKLKNSFQTLAETAKKQINQLEVKETIKIHSNKINFIFNFVLNFRSTITTLKINDFGLLNISHLISGYKKWLELESAIEETTSIHKTLYERE